jgi:hypothetical protein
MLFNSAGGRQVRAAFAANGNAIGLALIRDARAKPGLSRTVEPPKAGETLSELKSGQVSAVRHVRKIE